MHGCLVTQNKNNGFNIRSIAHKIMFNNYVQVSAAFPPTWSYLLTIITKICLFPISFYVFLMFVNISNLIGNIRRCRPLMLNKLPVEKLSNVLDLKGQYADF